MQARVRVTTAHHMHHMTSRHAMSLNTLSIRIISAAYLLTDTKVQHMLRGQLL